VLITSANHAETDELIDVPVGCGLRPVGPTHTHPFNGPFSGTTRVSRYQKGKTSLDFTETRDSEWQWHQLDHMQVSISFQTDNHTSTPPLKFFYRLDALPAAVPPNRVKALKAKDLDLWDEGTMY